MNSLLKGMKVAGNKAFTENGAITNKTSFNANLDLFALAGAKRGMTEQINTMFSNAYGEDKLIALKIAFYLRDIRGGQGERTTFRTMLNWLNKHDLAMFNKVVVLVPEYGRWDDVVEFVDNITVQNLVRNQLTMDILADHPSLLGKWMPSINTSSIETVKLARKWANILHMNDKEYRKMLVRLRSKIVLVESLMSAKAFGDIDYEKVPSNASKLYRKAFGKRDGTRYGEYLAAVNSGEKKINAATLYPYDLVREYTAYDSKLDETVEAQWKALPNYADSDGNALCMVDVSGSMMSGITAIAPITIAVSLGIYIAERNNGAFKDHYITFTNVPKLIKLAGYTLRDKVRQVLHTDVGYNTNVQAAFDMILTTAIKNKVPQSEMPTKIYIISDMEFDSSSFAGNKVSNFEAINRKYAAAGYTAPILVFWNVNSRNTNTPITQDDRGYMVSGASPSIFKATINAHAVTAEEMMLEVLNTPRYDAVTEVFNS